MIVWGFRSFIAIAGVARFFVGWFGVFFIFGYVFFRVISGSGFSFSF